jgi:hypothetical protein
MWNTIEKKWEGNDMQENTELTLAMALWSTRQERQGIPIKVVAEILFKEFQLEEINSLILELNKIYANTPKNGT